MRLFFLLPCLACSCVDAEVSFAFFGRFELFGIGVAAFFAGVFGGGGLGFFGLGLSTFWFHGGEEENVADGVVVGEHHHQPVDADPLSGGGGHGVAERTDEIEIHVHRFVVTGGLFGFHLSFEALVLIQRIVELVEAVGEFFAGHEELETFGDLGIFVAAAGEGGDVDGVVDDEGGVDQFCFDEGIKQFGLDIAEGEVGVGVDAVLLEVGQPLVPVGSDRFGDAADGGECLDERDAGERRRAVDLQIAVGDRPPHLQRVEEVEEELFGQCHEVVVVVPRPVKLNRGKFGVVGGVHPFVAEVAVDFKDRFHPAHNQPLEVEFWCDAQVAVDPEGIEMGDEWFGVGTAGDGVHHRCLHLEEAVIFEETTDERDDLGPQLESALHLWVHDHIQIALAVADLLIGQAVEFLGQGHDRFGDDSQIGTVQRQLPSLGNEGISDRLDDVAHLEELLGDGVVVPFRQIVAVVVDLHEAVAVLDLGEGGFAHDTDKPDTTGEGDAGGGVLFDLIRTLGQCGKAAGKFGGSDPPRDVGRVGVVAGFAEFFGFFDPLLDVGVVEHGWRSLGGLMSALAVGTEADDLHGVIGHLEAVLPGDRFLAGFDDLIGKLDDGAASGANEVVVVFFESDFVFFAIFAKRDRLDKIRFFKEGEGAVDGGDPYIEAVIGFADKPVDLFRRKMAVMLIKRLENRFPLTGEFKSVFFEEAGKFFEEKRVFNHANFP